MGGRGDFILLLVAEGAVGGRGDFIIPLVSSYQTKWYHHNSAIRNRTNRYSCLIAGK